MCPASFIGTDSGACRPSSGSMSDSPAAGSGSLSEVSPAVLLPASSCPCPCCRHGHGWTWQVQIGANILSNAATHQLVRSGLSVLQVRQCHKPTKPALVLLQLSLPALYPGHMTCLNVRPISQKPPNTELGKSFVAACTPSTFQAIGRQQC